MYLHTDPSTLYQIYQFIARANFHAPNGIRFGQDHYDDRMQASRRIEITPGMKNFVSTADPLETMDFDCVHSYGSDPASESISSHREEEGDEDLKNEDISTEDEKKIKPKPKPTSSLSDNNNDAHDSRPSSPPSGKGIKAGCKAPRDPIHMFGLFRPHALKHAQFAAVHVVADLFPRLAGVDAAMRALEIEVRRARKRVAKAHGMRKGRGETKAKTEGGKEGEREREEEKTKENGVDVARGQLTA
jgi:hypothetical protein